MKKYLLALLLAVPLYGQRPALNSPVIRFSDANGKPLVGGKLFSYSAGTTTPLQTFIDSTTGATNQNPVILDSTGSAKVFLGPNVYKFTLQNSAGVVQWTEDNIAQGMFTSGSVTSFTGNQGTTRVGAVVALTGDYSCAMISGAVCSLPTPPTLYNQTIKTVAGASPQEPILTFLPGTVGAIYTFTASGGTGYTTAPSVTFTGGGCAVEPTGGVSVASGAVTNPVITTAGSGCTTPPTPGFSGGGGTGATGATTLTPLGISCADNPTSTSTDCTFTFSTGSGNAQACVRSDVTSSRSINGTYQNTTNGLLYMSGTVSTSGSSTGSYYIWQGTSSPTLSGYGNTATATVSGGSPGFFEAILPGYFYQLRSADPAITGISKWTEVTGCGSSTSTAGLAPPITNNLTIGSTGSGNPSRDSGIAPGNVVVTNPTGNQFIVQPSSSAFLVESVPGVFIGHNGSTTYDSLAGSAGVFLSNIDGVTEDVAQFVSGGGIRAAVSFSGECSTCGGGTFRHIDGRILYDPANAGVQRFQITSLSLSGSPTETPFLDWVPGLFSISDPIKMPQTTPASSSAACTTGTFVTDANFLYACTATNTWKRAALTTF